MRSKGVKSVTAKLISPPIFKGGWGQALSRVSNNEFVKKEKRPPPEMFLKEPPTPVLYREQGASPREPL